MSKEVMMVLDCGSYSDKVFDVVLAFNKAGWVFKNDKMRYLPENDNGDFNWEVNTLSYERLERIFAHNQMNGQNAGVRLHHQSSDAAIDLWAIDTKRICLDVGIYRRTLEGGYTDMSWYILNIVAGLEKNGCPVTHYEFSEY